MQAATIETSVTTFKKLTDTVGTVQRVAWERIVSKLTQHEVGERDGSLFCGAEFHGSRERANVYARHLYILDIETSKRTGEVPPELEAVRQALMMLGWAAVIYSTWNHEPEAPRYRVVLLPAKAIVFAGNVEAIEADAAVTLGLAAMLGLDGVTDTTKLCAESMFYFPRHGEGREWFAEHIDGRALEADDLLTAAQRGRQLLEDETTYEDAAKPQTVARPDSVIAAYNAANSVSALLEQYGYSRKPRSTVDWRSQYQTSESYATRVFDDSRFVTLSDSDIQAGIGRRAGGRNAASGDAFDLFCHYEHKGDQKAAIKAAASALGLDTRKEAEQWTDVGAADAGGGPDYVTDGKGYPVANAHNIVEFLTHDPDFTEMFATDAFANKRVLLRQLPNIPGPRHPAKPMVLTETHIASILARVQRRLIPKATKAMVCDALDIIFPRVTVHPVKDYLDTLSWDGIPRVDNWLTTYLGANGEGDELRYISAAGRAWIISAVARVMQPGCKADAALILEGAQGIGKSTTASILAGQWFGDALPHLGTKDAASYLQGLWIIELAELANMARAEVEIVKSFMSRTEDRFRPAYARLEVSVPRQCVFIGSTNADNYLRDTTGNRRFWPIRCGKIDTRKLASDRDQLWAEALHLYQAGEKWWLDREIADIANEQQKERVDTDDPLTGRVIEIARGRERIGISVAQIVHDLFPDKRDQTLLVSRRIGQILRAEGWMQHGFTLPSGPYGRQKRFIKEGEA